MNVFLFHRGNKPRLVYWCLGCFIVLAASVKAQTPTDAIMMVPKQICGGVFYDRSHFDHYYEGTWLRVNGTIETVYRESFTPAVAIGILPRVNFLIGVPYVSTWSSEPNGGKFQGANGFQDLSQRPGVCLSQYRHDGCWDQLLGGEILLLLSASDQSH
jgi:hypothetical protein